MDHATRDHVLHLGSISSHVRRGCVCLERLRVAPLLENDERVGAEFRLETADTVSVGRGRVLDAALFGATGSHVGSKCFEYVFTLTGFGGDDG